MRDRSLLPRLLSSTVWIGLLIATVYWSQEYWYACLTVCIVVTTLGLRELLGLMRCRGMRVFQTYTLLGGIILTAAIFFSAFPYDLPDYLILCAFYAWGLGLFVVQARQTSLDGAAQTFFASIGAMVYVVFLFGFLIRINYLESVDGRWYVYYTFLTVYAADILAYLVGTCVGKRPLAPTISPHKTMEGAVGALLGACGASLAAQRFFLPELPVQHAVILGLLIGVFSQVGDLAESIWKRDAKVKDSGHSIPGMGGMLDMMDGLLCCAPLVFLYMKLILGL
jgi:phosphatidate cytidylyltransferase